MSSVECVRNQGEGARATGVIGYYPNSWQVVDQPGLLYLTPGVHMTVEVIIIMCIDRLVMDGDWEEEEDFAVGGDGR